jgi:hypothetical protein
VKTHRECPRVFSAYQLNAAPRQPKAVARSNLPRIQDRQANATAERELANFHNTEARCSQRRTSQKGRGIDRYPVRGWRHLF